MNEPSEKRRTVLVTGGSSGIGRVAARDLAARGDTLILVSRADGAGARVVDEIRADTGGDVHFLPADLSLLGDMRALAETVRARWPKLDVLLANAGAYFGRRRVTSEGIEATWALNHLGTAVPAILMADLLAAAAPSRVVITSSNAAAGARLRLDDPGFERRYQGFAAYAQSTLANQVMTLALAERLEAHGVRVHAMHPGFVATGFGADAGVFTPVVRSVQRAFGRTPEQGADTLTFLAHDASALATTGRYWVDRRERAMARAARDPSAPDRLWALTVEQAGLGADELGSLGARDGRSPTRRPPLVVA